MHLLRLFGIRNFLSALIVRIVLTMLYSFRVVLGLSPLWNCYPRGSFTSGATTPLITAYDDIEDKIGQE